MSFWNKIEKPGLDAPTPPPQPARAEPLPPAPERIDRVVAPPPEAAVPTAAAPAAPEVTATPGDHLRLGRGVRLEGKLTFSGTVRIDATFQGSIVTDGVLVIGEDAKVDAEITCGTVLVEGEVNGSVTARETVELRRTATLRGDVEAPSLVVERGATFEGASRRPAGIASPRAGKAAAAAPAPSVH